MSKLIIDEVIYLSKDGIDYTGLYVIIEAYKQLVFIKELKKKVDLNSFKLIRPAKNKTINLFLEKL